MLKKLKLVSLILAFLLLCSCVSSEIISGDSSIENDSSATENANSLPISTDGELRVHFLDVGQGDSIFIELPNGECALIDASEREMAGRIITFIDCLGYKKIDHLIATHPHADHIGGMKAVVSHFEIGEVYMPEAVTDTQVFIDLLEAIDKKGLSVTVAKAGGSYDFGGASANFVAPTYIFNDDMNNCSAVLHLSYGNRSFLFTGDAETDEEGTIEADIECDVLKAGHHGSSTSSGKYLLGKANPEIVVISCGAGNSYGHPHEEALERFENAGVRNIYRTDVSGNISISTNGSDIKVTENVKASQHKWVLNISSKKVHTSECKSATDMKEENKASSVMSLVELQERGYALCGSCKPKE